ncbi:peptidase M23 [Clostridiales bacterium AF36-10]|jgi:murein DD-endopeptidase MepM/ murein hydrolase activator NlpD|nr:peptidase M23 [Clostridiales bacterium AF36-10]
MRRSGKFLAAALSFALVLATPLSAQATKSGLSDAKNKKTALEAEKKKTEQELKNLEGLKSDTTAYVKKLDSSLESIGNELSKLNDDIDAKEKQIDTTKQELSEAKETEKSQYESMKLRIKYMYEKGDSTYVDLLMEAGSLSELLSKAEYITKISSYDRQKLDEYAATKEKIAEKEKALEEEHAELLNLQNETEAKQASVEKLLAAKQTELQNYETKIASAEGQISEYAKSIEAQENQIKSIEAEIKRKEEEARKKAEEEKKKAAAANKAAQTYKTVSLGDISFTWPCPASGRITSGFGGRKSPTKGASSNHQGIDISAPTGTSIVAAAAGEVVIATYSSSAGNYVMISHGGGVYTVYMHASSLLVSQGQSVKKGQTIAKVGSTGYSTGSHLHFGVRVNGSYVNPTKYVSP